MSVLSPLSQKIPRNGKTVRNILNTVDIFKSQFFKKVMNPIPKFLTALQEPSGFRSSPQ